MLANMSLEQHAFSFNQKNQFKIPEQPTSSGNIREKFETTKDVSSNMFSTKMKGPATPSDLTATGADDGAGTETLGMNTPDINSAKQTNAGMPSSSKMKGTSDEDDTQSCYQTVQDGPVRKRKWYSLF